MAQQSRPPGLPRLIDPPAGPEANVTFNRGSNKARLWPSRGNFGATTVKPVSLSNLPWLGKT